MNNYAVVVINTDTTETFKTEPMPSISCALEVAAQYMRSTNVEYVVEILEV